MYSFHGKNSIAKMNRYFLIAGWSAVCLVGILTGLSCADTADHSQENFSPGVRVEMEGTNERQLLSFYVGGMVSEGGKDPFDAGFAWERNGSYFLAIDKILERLPDVGSDMLEAAEDGVIDWEELEPIIQTHYYSYRPIPGSIEELRASKGDWRDSDEWFSFEVNGVMSARIRRIHVRKADLIRAVSSYKEFGNQLLYQTGTTFISEHVEGGHILELSALTKREDGFWDFYAYDESGAQTSTIEREPSDLIVPTRCVGCHFGNRLFEPERSFPADPRPGPDGPRKLYVSDESKNVDVVRDLDEHRKRSDTILGLYGTLFISQLINTPDLSPEFTALLKSAGF